MVTNTLGVDSDESGPDRKPQHHLEERSRRGDKVAAYGWKVSDQPAELAWMSKHDLRVDHTYQRDLNHRKTLELARDWSWIACGAIVVAMREVSGVIHFFVVDGQHRVAAALKRSDIEMLPCLIFNTTEPAEEAGAFIKIQKERKPISTVDQHRAALVSSDPIAIEVEQLIQSAGRKASSASGAGTVGCLSTLYSLMRNNKNFLHRLWPLITSICEGEPLNERIVQGLVYIERNIQHGESLLHPNWAQRVRKIGYAQLLNGASASAAYHAKGGAHVWADGMLQQINKGLRRRLSLKGRAAGELGEGAGSETRLD